MKQKRGFHFRIVIPVILTIAAFIVAFNLIFLPTFENNLVDKKKEMIRELTHTAWSILEKLYEEQLAGTYDQEAAQKEALSILQKTRYGEEHKDYFWVTDLSPRMLLHPYRPDLNGSDLSNYADPNDKRLFVESVSLVNSQGEGYIDYFWQWKDDSTRIVPKLSFVKGFAPWGWVIGTGIYMEDVQEEIAAVKSRLTWVSLIISLFAAFLLSYLLRQSFRTEAMRQQAEEELRTSREKYRTLVEASTEASFMVIQDKLVYYNPPLAKMLGYEGDELYQYQITDLFMDEDPDETGLKRLEGFLSGPADSDQFEIMLRAVTGDPLELVLNLSRVTLSNKQGYIGMVRRASREFRVDKQIEHLPDELQATLLMMNQPVTQLMRPPLFCRMEQTIQEVAAVMSANNEPVALITGEQRECIGLVTDRDLRERVLAASLNPSTQVFRIMSAPVIEIPEHMLLFEAQLTLQEKKVAHLVVRNRPGVITGILSQLDLARLSAFSNALILQEIDTSNSLQDLIGRSEKLSAMARVMIETGAQVRHIGRFISTVADRVTERIIWLGMQKFGPAPVPFALIAMGSEGRQEQSLATDQDNAIIFDDRGEKDPGVMKYFESLAGYINKSLDQAGYRFCDGEIMARNPRWCQSATQWKQYFNDWILNADPQNLLDVNIFFDFKRVYGDESLVSDIQQTIDTIAENKQVFFYHLAQQALVWKPPLDMFGNLHFFTSDLQPSRHIDLKKCLMPLTAFARVYSLKYQVHERNTLVRFQHLADAGVINQEFHLKATQAFEFLSRLRLQHQSRCLARQLKPDNLLMETELSEIDQGMLKKVLSYVTEVQARIKSDFPSM